MEVSHNLCDQKIFIEHEFLSLNIVRHPSLPNHAQGSAYFFYLSFFLEQDFPRVTDDKLASFQQLVFRRQPHSPRQSIKTMGDSLLQ